jgi:hypothetical protein
LVLAPVASASVALAADGDASGTGANREYLFTSDAAGDEQHVTLDVQSGRLFGSPATVVSGGVGVKVHRYLSLGVALGALATGLEPDGVEDAGKVGLYFGGIYASSRAYTWRFLSADVWSVVGGGSVGYRAPAPVSGEATAAAEPSPASDKVYEKDDFRLFEAGLGIAVHVSKRADLSFGVGFRRASDVDVEGLDGGLDGSFPYVALRGNL